MELGNELPGDLGPGNTPRLGTLEFEGIGTRVGKTLDPETKEHKGIVIEWWFLPLPWFRFRMPFDRLHAITFIQKLLEAMELENVSANQET